MSIFWISWLPPNAAGWEPEGPTQSNEKGAGKTTAVLCLFIVKPSLSFDLLRVAGYSLFPRDKGCFPFLQSSSVARVGLAEESTEEFSKRASVSELA
jgi:hypothetical protein